MKLTTDQRIVDSISVGRITKEVRDSEVSRFFFTPVFAFFMIYYPRICNQLLTLH